MLLVAICRYRLLNCQQAVSHVKREMPNINILCMNRLNLQLWPYLISMTHTHPKFLAVFLGSAFAMKMMKSTMKILKDILLKPRKTS